MIELKKINKYYPGGETPLHVLKDVDFAVKSGEFVAIMGESGSGKSTLINIIGFIDQAYQGEYLFQGEEIRRLNDNKLSHLRNRNVGFVFQKFNLIQTATTVENVELPLLYQGYGFKEAGEKAKEILTRVGLSEKFDKLPRELSGGQQQRVSIARACVHQPQFIIADEPTGALDSQTSKEIIDLFHQMNQELGISIIMVTHDPGTTTYCHKIFHMVDGRLTCEVKE